MQVCAAIFDFDGTIADTLDEVVRLLNGLANDFGYRPAAPDEVELLRGMPPAAIAKRLGVSWHQLPRIAARMRAELSRTIASVRPFDGMIDAIADLRARGICVGLLTSNSRRNVELFLGSHPIAFDFISTSSGLWSKSRRLDKLMRHHGLTRERTAYIGDELRDLEAARALGVRAVAVAWGYTRPELLESHSPDRLVGSVPQLVPALLELLG